MRLIFIFLVLFCSQAGTIAQQKKYTVAQAHSHNDYLQAEPFIAAFNAGFGSIEADIFPVNGNLLVAHSAKEINPLRSLNTLYLQPLLNILGKHKALKDANRELQLLIDIKKDTKTCMALLQQQLRPLKNQLSTPDRQRKIKIVMTGEIPLPNEFDEYPAYFFYDHNLSMPLSAAQWKRVGMVSVNFKTYSKWKGLEAIQQTELDQLKQLIDQAHQQHKPFRFWGMPDQPESWTLQKNLSVDWIGTDHIRQLSAFLKTPKP